MTSRSHRARRRRRRRAQAQSRLIARADRWRVRVPGHVDEDAARRARLWYHLPAPKKLVRPLGMHMPTTQMIVGPAFIHPLGGETIEIDLHGLDRTATNMPPALIEEIQRILNRMQYDCDWHIDEQLAVDGIWGPRTQRVWDWKMDAPVSRESIKYLTGRDYDGPFPTSPGQKS